MAKIKAETDSGRVLVEGEDHEAVALEAAKLIIAEKIEEFVYINQGKRTLETLTLAEEWGEDEQDAVARFEDQGSLGSLFVRFVQQDGEVVKYDNEYLED